MKIIKAKENDGFYNAFIKKAVVIIDDKEKYCIFFIKNNGYHNKNGPSLIYETYSLWYYKDRPYGSNNSFTIKTWKKKVKELKRQEQLKIFK